MSEGWATAGPNAKLWFVSWEVKWTGLRNPPGELCHTLDPYMARRKLNHMLGAERCQSLKCLPTVPTFPCSVTLCLSLLSPRSPPPRPGKGSALSLFCFLNATSPRGRPVRVSAQRLSLMVVETTWHTTARPAADRDGAHASARERRSGRS